MSLDNSTPTAMYTSRTGGDTYKQKRGYNGQVVCEYCHTKGHTRADCNKLKKCDFCHKTGHVKGDCFQLIGYPADFKGKRQSNAVTGPLAGNNCSDNAFAGPQRMQHQCCHPPIQPRYDSCPQQCAQYQGMLPHPPPSSSGQREFYHNGNGAVNGSVNMAGTGIPYLHENTSVKWIIDTGATNHMIGDPKYLMNGGLLEHAGQVQLPTGDSARVSHVGNCSLRGEVVQDFSKEDKARHLHLSSNKSLSTSPSVVKRIYFTARSF
ncbi:hypothetical protein H5410_016708, partial [Solanum commersonii]